VAGDRSAKAVLADYEALSAAVGLMQAWQSGLAGAPQAQIVGIRREAALAQPSPVPASRLGEIAKGLRLGALERSGYKTSARSSPRVRGVFGWSTASGRPQLGR